MSVDETIIATLNNLWKMERSMRDLCWSLHDTLPDENLKEMLKRHRKDEERHKKLLEEALKLMGGD
jgi:ferritin-like metal-binding protein YciE